MNKCGNLSDRNNYRPIALATIMSKLFESVIFYLNVKCFRYVLISLVLKKGTVQTCDLCTKRND